jgi:lipoate-protein ligase A
MIIARHKNLVPNTLHLYRRDRPTISVGYFEKIEESVNLELAKRIGACIVRRVTGGSAIYTDPDQIIYSVIVNNEVVPENPNDTYKLICGAVIRALGLLGVAADFKPINDIVVGGKKISGSAQVRKWNIVLQHGTLIIDADFDLMFRILKTKKKIRTPEEMTSLAIELGRKPAVDEVKKALIRAFAEEFKVELVKGVLTHFEEKLIRQLIEEKYGKDEHALLR